MHAVHIVQDLLDRVCPSMHAKRRTALANVTAAATLGGLGVVRMGKKLGSEVGLKHRIKRCDRLLGNAHLWREHTLVYGAMARRVLAGQPRPAIVVDWSPVRDDGSLQLLRAAAIVKGRAFTVYEEVHPEKQLGKLAVHRDFMRTLRTVLPPSCKPVIITDAGFRATWFKMLDQLGYAWIGRIRNADRLREVNTDTWIGCKDLYAKASAQARDLGNFLYTRTNSTLCRLVLNKTKRKGRQQKTKFGKPALSAHCKKQSAAQREPWLLAVAPSLKSLSATQIVQLYAGRMQIEQTFRDLKNAQWGMGLRQSQTRGQGRFAILLLIGALASFALWVIGLAARHAGFSIEYGSRSKAPTTLSILSLATHWLDEQYPPPLTKLKLARAICTLRSMVIAYEI